MRRPRAASYPPRHSRSRPIISKQIPFLSRAVARDVHVLLEKLNVITLKTPLAKSGIRTWDQLSILTPEHVSRRHYPSINRLLRFVHSPYFKMIEPASNLDHVMDLFEHNVNQAIRKAWRYIQAGQVIPSPEPTLVKKSLKLPDLPGASASRGIAPALSVAHPRPLNYHRKIMMTLGINKYSQWPQLRNAVSDASSIRDHFQQQLGFDTANLLIDGDVTKESIRQFFQKTAPSYCQESDLLVMSFHGHGHTMTFQGRTCGFLVPVNAPKNPSPYDLISMDDIASWLKYIPARHVLLILDSCFSGLTAIRGARPKKKASHALSDSNPSIRETYLRYHLDHRSRIVINAGHSVQQVSDGGWGQDHSIFTGAILSSTAHQRSVMSIYDFFSSIHSTVVNQGSSPQIPTLGKLPGDEGSDIFLNLGRGSLPVI